MDLKKTNEILDKALNFIVSEEFSDEQKVQIEQDTLENFDRHINPGWLKYRKSVSTNSAAVEFRDHDSCYVDLYGNEYIDCLGGFGIFNFGHRNPEILKYVEAQLKHQALHSQELLDPLRGYLAEALSSITPGDLQYCFFTNGGAEAVEMALKLSRIATGKRHYIATINGFHGKSMGALSVSGKDTYRAPYIPSVQQVSHVTYGNIDELETTIFKLQKVGEQIAAVILEPIQGEAGIIVPPEGYLKNVRTLCDKHDIVLILDEIQTGMARTGTFFRCEAEGITPDIMTYGKAFGGGIMPITGIIARPKMWIEKLKENPWILGSPTFGGNPICCAAALGAINFMVKHDVPKMSREKGDYVMKALKKLQEKYPKIIVDVRGVGLMIGIEFPSTEVGYSISKGLFSRKVMIAGTLNNAATLRLEPPSTMKYSDFDKVFTCMDAALADTKKQFNL
ncbi:MAG: putrescine aminotransferase [Elusimicrobiota bacterium]|jgi:putrescine aminotransferase|nr:putrescine aminotransferase [Elusimicrobiota bacterium]